MNCPIEFTSLSTNDIAQHRVDMVDEFEYENADQLVQIVDECTRRFIREFGSCKV